MTRPDLFRSCRAALTGGGLILCLSLPTLAAADDRTPGRTTPVAATAGDKPDVHRLTEQELRGMNARMLRKLSKDVTSGKKKIKVKGYSRGMSESLLDVLAAQDPSTHRLKKDVDKVHKGGKRLHRMATRKPTVGSVFKDLSGAMIAGAKQRPGRADSQSRGGKQTRQAQAARAVTQALTPSVNR